MRKAKGTLFLLFILMFASCPGPGTGPVPLDFPPGELDPVEFCIDFEKTSSPEAVNGANAALLYADLGVIFLSNPVIFNNPALSSGAQSLFQGNPGAARPERTCGPLEIVVNPDVRARKVEFEARNLGFISIPVEVTVIAYGSSESGPEVEVDRVNFISQSEFGDLRPVEFITLNAERGEPDITRVSVTYGTCPPHVVIDNLCFTPPDVAGTFGRSEDGADRLVYYFDNRERHSYIRLANLSDDAVEAHVQIWIVNSEVLECEEINFYDTYTPGDVHTYEMLNISLNSPDPPLSFSADVLAGKYGFVVVSRSTGPADSLIGNMNIIDDAGYEYRTNAVAPESGSLDSSFVGTINFSSVNGFNQSDLIGFSYSETTSHDTVSVPSVTTYFGWGGGEVTIFDQNEVPEECFNVPLGCYVHGANIAIDNSMPNTKVPDGISKACDTDIITATNSSGFLTLPYETTICSDPSIGDEDLNCIYDTHFVGFIGLNNGSDQGSFDSWWGGRKTVE